MKSFFALLSIAGLSASVVTHGAVLFRDSFLSGSDPSAGEYADGALLDNANPTIINANTSWSNPTDRLATTSVGLSYLAGSINVAGQGGSVIRGNPGGGTSNQTYTRGLNDQPLALAPSEVWFSFLVNAGSTAVGQTILASFDLDVDTGGVTSPQAGFIGNQFSLQGNLVGSVTASSVNLLIGKLDYQQSGTSGLGDEFVTWWVNPTDISTEALLNSTAAYSQTTAGNFAFGPWGVDAISITAGGAVNSGNQIDEIYIAQTLDDLASAFSGLEATEFVLPEPDSVALLFLGCLLLRSIRRVRNR